MNKNRYWVTIIDWREYHGKIILSQGRIGFKEVAKLVPNVHYKWNDIAEAWLGYDSDNEIIIREV